MPSSLRPDELGPRLAEVYRVVGPLYRRVLRQVEQDLDPTGVSVGVRAVLDELQRDGPATVPQVAASLDLSRQFVQRMVNDARALDWVRLSDNPAHRRSSLVEATEAGLAAIASVHAREHALMGHVGGGLTAIDVNTTLRVLGEMLLAVERLEGGTG